MPAASIVLALAAFVCVGIGFVTSWIPVVGTVFSFAAPMLAIGGIVAGGVSLSRAKREGRPGDAAMVGIVLSSLALVPALLVAMTCGVCNALFTAGGVQTSRDFDVRLGQGRPLVAPDAGRAGKPLPPLPPFPSPQAPRGTAPAAHPPGGTAPATPPSGGSAPSQGAPSMPSGTTPAPASPGPPPPAFPPPPIAPKAP